MVMPKVRQEADLAFAGRIDKPQEKVYCNGRTFMFHLEVQATVCGC